MPRFTYGELFRSKHFSQKYESVFMRMHEIEWYDKSYNDGMTEATVCNQMDIQISVY